MYIYVLFFWPLRLRKSSTRDVLNRFSVNVVRFDGPLVIYDLRGCGLVLRAHREVFEIFLDGVSRRKAGVELADSSNCRGTLVKFWLRGYTLCIDIAPCEKYNNLFRNMRMALVSSSSYISFYSRYDSTYCFLSASRYTSYDFWWNVQFQFFYQKNSLTGLVLYESFRNDASSHVNHLEKIPTVEYHREFLTPRNSKSWLWTYIHIYIYTLLSWERGKQHASGNGQDQWPSAAKRS